MKLVDKVWLAVHAWYHPNSEFDNVRYSIQKAIETSGLETGIIRGMSLPYGKLGQTFFPLFLRNILSYGNYKGIIHDIYGDSVFTNVDVSTIHDLYSYTFQQGVVNKAIQIQLRSLQGYGRTLKLSKKIIVDTPFTKDEILKIYGEKYKEKIRVIPLAVGKPSIDTNKEKKYDILWVGSSARRKSPLRFLKSVYEAGGHLRIAFKFNQISQYVSDDLTEIHRMVTKIRENGTSIDFIDLHIDREKMYQLYQISKSLVSTSTYEGFHLPVAEAYVRGLHVILPEIKVYKSQYGNEEGVHWYKELGELPKMMLEARNYKEFYPDKGILDRLSYEHVGKLLKDMYQSLIRN